MKIEKVRVGDILALSREPITIAVDQRYRRIGIYSWGKGFLHRPAAPGSEMGSLRYFDLPENALVLSNIQAWEAAVAVSGPTEQDHVASNRFLPYLPIDDSRVSVTYLLHYFLSEDGLAALRRASPGTQVRNRTLSIKLFEATQLPLPDIKTQVRASTYLDEVGSRLRRVRSLRQDAWRPVNAALRQLPWEVPLNELMQEDSDEVHLDPHTVYRQVGVYGKGGGIIDRGRFFGGETKYARMLRVKAGQIVLSRLKAFEGAVAIVDDQHDGALVSKEFPTFTLTDRVDRRYIRAVLTNPSFEEQLRASSVGIGARRERVDASRFLSIKVPVPSRELQESLGHAAEACFRIRSLQQRAEQLADVTLVATRNEVFSSMR